MVCIRPAEDRADDSHWVWLLPPLLLGAFLRLFRLSAQVLGGDELNGVQRALEMSIAGALRTYHLADNCLPLTALYRGLLDLGFAPTETLFRAPSVVCGLLLLVLMPVAIARRLSMRIAVASAWLVALSPVLVLYARIARPYEALALAAFCAAGARSMAPRNLVAGGALPCSRLWPCTSPGCRAVRPGALPVLRLGLLAGRGQRWTLSGWPPWARGPGHFPPDPGLGSLRGLIAEKQDPLTSLSTISGWRLRQDRLRHRVALFQAFICEAGGSLAPGPDSRHCRCGSCWGSWPDCCSTRRCCSTSWVNSLRSDLPLFTLDTTVTRAAERAEFTNQRSSRWAFSDPAHQPNSGNSPGSVTTNLVFAPPASPPPACNDLFP